MRGDAPDNESVPRDGEIYARASAQTIGVPTWREPRHVLPLWRTAAHGHAPAVFRVESTPGHSAPEFASFTGPGYTGPVRYSDADRPALPVYGAECGPELEGALVTPPYATPSPDIAGFPVVLLNGPPRSGKDTAANGLLVARPGSALMRFSAPLKVATHGLFGLPIDPDRYEDSKDTPSADFMGLTPRGAYIAVSEQAVKRTFGRAFFGRVMVERLRRLTGAEMAVMPDCGFAVETTPVIQAVGSANVILIRVHRPGYTFAHDSRSYINLDGVHTVDVHNTGTVAELQRKVVDAVARWISLPT